MKKYLILITSVASALILVLLVPRAVQATVLGNVGGCVISDVDRGSVVINKEAVYYVVKAVKLADVEAINNLYLQYWGRGANCEELQRHLDWGTPLGILADWLNDSPHSVPVSPRPCNYPAGTTKDAVSNINNIYLEEAGRNMSCNEALFHLQTDHVALRNWLVNNASFSRSYQTWKQSLPLVEGATYRDESKFWLIQNGQRHWVPDVPTMFAWGLIFDDSTHIDLRFRGGFYYMVPEGSQLQFKNGKYKTAVQNRYKGSGYGTMPAILETAIKEHRSLWSLYGSAWRGYAEFRGSYCSQEKYCTLK